MAIEKLPSTGDMPRSTGVPASLTPGETADSAGYPWAGRTFEHHVTTFADDDGSLPQEWAEAVHALRTCAAQLRTHPIDSEARTAALHSVVDAHAAALLTLSRQRLLVPLVTEAGDVGVTPEGRTVEKTQELSIVTIAAPDGRTAMPVFSSVETMKHWNHEARPIPMPAPQIALAAAQEATDLIIIDAGSEDLEFGVRRTELEAVALASRAVPSWADPDVVAAFEESVTPEPNVSGVRLSPGDPDSRLVAPETEVLLSLHPGLTQAQVQQLLTALQQRWAADERIATRVDSLKLTLRETSGNLRPKA